MNRPKKLCIFTLPFYPDVGGLEAMAMLIAKVASESGIVVEVVTKSEAKDERDDHKFSFTIIRTSSPLKRLKAFIRSDVVLFFNVSLHGLAVALLSRRRIILSHHIRYVNNGGIRNGLEYLKRQLTRGFENIAVSRFIAEGLPGNCRIVENAYDSTVFFRDSSVKKIKDFVFCGRLVSDKGCEHLLSAFSVVIKSFPGATLTIIGDGPERRSLDNQVCALGINSSVEFLGTLSGDLLSDALQHHRCMVIPSQWEEPFGIVALEGIACCDTIIAANRGGLPDAVGRCGLLVEPSPEGLACAMNAVMKAIQEEMILPGQTDEAERSAHLARHHYTAVAKQYIDLCFPA